MLDRVFLTDMIHKIQDQAELSQQDQKRLDEFLETEEGRQQWVNELCFQADLMDVLKSDHDQGTKDEMEIDFIEQSQDINSKRARPVLSSAWLIVAALLLVSVMSIVSMSHKAIQVSTVHLAEIIDVTGLVNLNRDSTIEEVKIGMLINEGDEIKLPLQSYVKIQTADGSILTLGENSHLQFANAHQRDKGGWDLSLNQGAIDAHIKSNQSIRLKTNQMTVDVTSSRFSINCDRDHQSIELYEGKMEVCTNKSPLKTYKIKSGQGLSYSSTLLKMSNFLLPEKSWIQAEVISIDRRTNIIRVLKEEEEIYLSNSLITHRVNTRPDEVDNFQVGKMFRLKLEGLALPKIVASHSI